MAQVTSLPYVGAARSRAAEHPIGPLTAQEIAQSAALLRAFWPANTNLQFKTITLLEPPKAQLLPYLVAERAGQTPAPIERKSFLIYYIRNTVSGLSVPEQRRAGGLMPRIG